jgi:glycosyltransferase involved in cell wall biosynthesis
MGAATNANVIKVCYVVPDLGYGGAQKQLCDLVSNLSRAEFEPSLINLHQEFTSDQLRQLGVRVVDLEYRGRRNFTKVFQLNRILVSERPDVLHCFLTSGNFYGLLGSVGAGVRVRIAGERSFGTRFRGLRRAVYPRTLALADAVVTNSRRNQEWLERTFLLPQHKVRVIHNGCRPPVPAATSTLQMKRRALGIQPHQFVIATLTHLTPEKDVGCLVRAAARLDRGGLDFRVLVAGEGPQLETIRETIRAHRLEARIWLAGLLPHDEALLIAQLCDAFVLTSRYEGMPNALMEAMAYGRPCVASNVGGIPELIEPGHSGLHFEPGDDEALASHLTRLAGDPGLREQLGENARRRVTAEFSVAKMVRMHEDLYRSLLDGNASRTVQQCA